MLSCVGFVLSLDQQEVTPEQRERRSLLGSSGVAAPRVLRMGVASALGAARRRISLGADGLSKCKQIFNMPIKWGTGGFFDKNEGKKKKKEKASSNEVPAPSLKELELLGKIIIILKTVKEHAFPQSLKKKKSYSF